MYDKDVLLDRINAAVAEYARETGDNEFSLNIGIMVSGTAVSVDYLD